MDILKNADREYMEVYRGLSGKVSQQYMDEFLQAIHKKTPVSYEVGTQLLTAENVFENHCIELPIQRKGWGFWRKILKEILISCRYISM